MNGMHGIIFSYDKENGLRELLRGRFDCFEERTGKAN